MQTLTAAYAHYGVKPRNPRWSWSARSEDGQTVVLTLWEDELIREGNSVTVDFRGHPRLHLWRGLHGNRERIRNLICARENCDGRFRVVLLRAKDLEAVPRKIAARHPEETLVMRLTHLDERTGEFRAESVYS